MILELVRDLGPWAWLIIGLLLLIGEAFIPGVFLIWFGLAGVVIGGLTLLPFTDVSWWPWQAQLVAFGVLSLVFILVGNRLFPSSSADDEASKLNDPLARYVGTEAVLSEAINGGVGRAKLGDTTWRVKGADAASGTRVIVTGTGDACLYVEAIQDGNSSG